MRSLVATCLALALTACSRDFGDAPDGGPTGYPPGILVGGASVPAVGTFPSLSASDGARVQSVSDATLGPAATLESDALVTNADVDDGNVFLMVIVVSIPPPAQMIVQVNGQTPGNYFLNALIDLNMNGAWGDVGTNGEQEWAVQNFPVTIAPGPSAVIPLPFAFGWGNRLPVTTWMRLALTREQIPGGPWTGTGEFSTGEIEDHFVTIPLRPGGGGGECDAKPIPHMDCGGPYRFPDGVNQIPVQCTITNVGGAGNVDWTIAPIAGCAVALAPAANLTGPRPIGCPDGRIVLDFTATRGDPLPCAWSFVASGEDPPSRMTAVGLDAGYTDSTGSFLLTTEKAEVAEVWVETLSARLEKNTVVARVELNQGSREASAGGLVDVGIMYPDGALAERRVELSEGAAEASFETKGAGIHMVRVLRIVGGAMDHDRSRDKTLMGAVEVR
jgi:hypothetical protein